jgi:hypothetical protein
MGVDPVVAVHGGGEVSSPDGEKERGMSLRACNCQAPFAPHLLLDEHLVHFTSGISFQPLGV